MAKRKPAPKICFNGINGDTGEYLVKPLRFRQAASLFKRTPPEQFADNFLRSAARNAQGISLALPLDVAPENVTQAGWAIVLHRDEDSEVKKALAPLIEHRRQQINQDALVKELEYLGDEGNDHVQWLARHGVAIGNIEPTLVPYYILLIGSPQRIPFVFGQNLDVEYAVGRLHFETAAEYSQYVASVIDYETSVTVPNAKEAVFFGTRHDFDAATQLSADWLVNPLTDGIPANGLTPAKPGVAQHRGYQMRKFWGETATKAALTNLLAPATGSKPPAFLLTATHGMGWPTPQDRQLREQGALVCQDWPGFGTITADHYFAADHLPAESRVQGMIVFLFACYGAGTPSHDRFLHKFGQPPPTIAGESFIAALPKKLLAHPQGGALACIGHVERAWGYSIVPPGLQTPQILAFQNTIGRILVGQPVGHAVKDFNDRYAQLSAGLAEKVRELSFRQGVTNEPAALKLLEADWNALAVDWLERNDAQGYAVIGDPAVQLRKNDLT